MTYKIYTTDNFDRQMGKLSQEEKKRIGKIFVQLRNNPYAGDQLQIKILREKRLREKRIYFLVFDELNAVLAVAISNKKTQQETIDHILKYIKEYRDYLKRIIRE